MIDDKTAVFVGIVDPGADDSEEAVQCDWF